MGDNRFVKIGENSFPTLADASLIAKANNLTSNPAGDVVGYNLEQAGDNNMEVC